MNFIGIDLGTTYSTVATVDENGHPIVLRNAEGSPLTPSAVYIEPDGTPVVGEDAKDRMQNGLDVAVFFKRFMGQDDYAFTAADGRDYSATDLSAILLSKLKRDAEMALGSEVRKAVITVPAYFNDLQRNCTMEAGRRAGLDVMRIINEPTAAAIHYGLGQASNMNVLVYDLGGGTFDVTILKIDGGKLSVMATGGDHELGGKDFDDALIAYISDLFRQETGLEVEDDMEAYADLVFAVENLKKQLSTRSSATVRVACGGQRGRYEVSREKFEELTAPLLHTTQEKCRHILEEAGLRWSDVDGALLVGGSTKMPMVSNWIKQMTGRDPLRGINVEEAVALGAAIQASVEALEAERLVIGGKAAADPRFKLAGKVEIQDVMSHSLGTVAVSADGSKYINSIIVRKNTPVPVTDRRRLEFATRPSDDNVQTVYLTQGETSDLERVKVVGKYLFKGITHNRNGKAIIEIAYSYDANGVIVVKGKQVDASRDLIVEKVPLEDDLDWMFEAPAPASLPLSVIVTIDCSYSMWKNPVMKAMGAGIDFARNLPFPSTRLRVRGFANSEKDMSSGWVSSLEDAELAFGEAPRFVVDGIIGFGNGCSPIAACGSLLDREKDRTRVLVILTDGVWDDQRKAIAESDVVKASGVTIIAIGFGSADKEFLKRIRQATATHSSLTSPISARLSAR